MKFLLKPRLQAVVLAALVITAGHAQEADDTAAVPEPSLTALEAQWWSYFEGNPEEVKQRVDSLLAKISIGISELQPENQEIAESVYAAVQDNLAAYIALLTPAEISLEELPPPAVGYSLDDLLRLAATARDARAGAIRESLEVQREQRILDGATRRRDQAFKDYVAAATGDGKFLAGLRLLQARSAQAISQRRLELLTLSYDQAAAYAAAAEQRAVDASERLTLVDADGDYAKLVEELAEAEAAVAAAQEAFRTAEVAASGVARETAQGRMQQRLQQQKAMDARIELEQAKVSLGMVQARRWWTALQLGSVNDLDILQEQTLQWSEMARRIEQDLAAWYLESEEEVLAAQTASRDGLDRASRRLLDQRIGVAQEALGHLSDLEAAAEDLKLLSRVVDAALAESTGALSSWWTGFKRGAQQLYLRTAALAESTLFSIGETPVTGEDILRVFIILAVAYLLSRGVRHAIGRVSRDESPGTQASLYTVGRLSHYAIIIIALFVALSSMGLDFSNLALVAGALSVGIGFGLQSIVSNFVSGLIILFEHTLRVGDYVELDTGLTGTVKSINVRSTLINTNDNIDIVVPNSEFVSNRLTNWTLGERILRVRIPFGVAYGSDKEVVRKAALEAANEVPYTLTHMKGREPDIWLVEFGDSSLNFLLLVWVNRQGARRPTRTRAAYLWALEDKLAHYGIEIPFPQRDLNLRRGFGAAPVNLVEPDETLPADPTSDAE